MTYLGMEFNNYEELESWSKQGKIDEYKKLARMFDKHATMELNNRMCEVAEILNKRFGLTWNEIESLEFEAIA